MPSIRRHGQAAAQWQDSRYVPATRQALSSGCAELDHALVAAVAVVRAERIGEPLLQLSVRGQLLDDVRATDELALDEDLRNRRPARERRELLAETRVGEDVDRGHGRARTPKRRQCALRVAAGGKG